jgi:hypothetical protein
MHMFKGEVVNKVVVEVKIETGEADLFLPILFKFLQMPFYVGVNGQCGFAYLSFFGFDVLVKLIIDILLRFFPGRLLFGYGYNSLVNGM